MSSDALPVAKKGFLNKDFLPADKQDPPICKEELSTFFPFFRHLKRGTYFKVNRFIKFFLYGWIRVVLMLVPLIIGGILSKILLFPFRKRTKLNEETGYSDLPRWVVRINQGLCRFVGWGLTAGGRVKVKVTGKRDKNVKLFVANHTSFMDPVILVRQFGCSCIVNHNLKKAPFLSSLLLGMESIFVDRLDPESRSLAGRIIKARTKCDITGPSVMIFPEGTTSNNCGLMRFNRGAFHNENVFHPMVFSYDWKESNPAFDVGSFWPMVLAMLTSRPVTCNIHILPQMQATDPTETAVKVQKLMSDFLDVPIFDLTIKEKVIYEKFLDKKITWNELLEKFEEKNLSLIQNDRSFEEMYQEQLILQNESIFNKRTHPSIAEFAAEHYK
ncbi:hypothetical protein PCE1_002738 [Barthelona sp. PCE]